MAARNGITLHRAVLSGIGVVSPEAGLAVLHNAFFESMHSFHTKHTMPLSGVFTGVAFSWPAFIASDKKPVLREFERNKYTSGKEKDFTSAKVEPNTETDLRWEHISNEVSREESSSDDLREIVSDSLPLPHSKVLAVAFILKVLTQLKSQELILHLWSKMIWSLTCR